MYQLSNFQEWGQSKITSSWKDAGNNIKTDNDQDVRITSDWSNYQNYRLVFRVLDHNGRVVYSTSRYRSGYDTEVTSKSSSTLTMYNGSNYRLQVRRENFWDPETHTTGRWTP